MNINVYREYAKSILENMLDNTLIDIKSSLYLEKISPKTPKIQILYHIPRNGQMGQKPSHATFPLKGKYISSSIQI
jgi:hypothetical protein